MSEVELFERAAAELPRLPGWCTPEKARKLMQVILARKLTLCVEIGVFGGSSLVPQLLALKHLGHGKAVGIDPWSHEAALEHMQEEVHRDWWSRQVDLEAIRQQCLHHLSRLDLLGFCELLRAKAEDVVDRFADGSIELLHIDGNHSESLSQKDAELYLPKVAKGGHIFFDDISWTERSVVTTGAALKHLLANGCALVDQTGDCAILCKK